MSERLYRCRRCFDAGWVLVRPETNEAAPCRDCNLDQWDRWNRDEYAPSFSSFAAARPASVDEAREKLQGQAS